MFKRSNSTEITSLNLQTPPKAEQQQASQPSISQPCRSFNLTPEGRAHASAEVTRRTQEWMKSGLKPTTFFSLFDPKAGGPVVLWNAEKKPLVPLFTSFFSASDYATVVKCEAKIAAYKIEALPTLAQAWITAGICSFMIDFCPRCKFGNFFKMEILQSSDQFMLCWAATASSKRVCAELLVRQFQTNMGTNPKQARSVLEEVRDHFDCANPYVHWIIAVLAGMDGDMQANAASIARLEQFGPEFVGVLKGDSFGIDSNSQLMTMPKAMIGLLSSYGLLQLPNQPVAS